MPSINGQLLARWQTTLDGVECSPLAFYEEVQTAIAARELPAILFSQVTRCEGGWFSARRIYLRIRGGKLFFDVSAFPAGNALVVSYWLHEHAPGVLELLAEIPLLGFVVERTARAGTYYQVDYVEYFQRAVHDSILGAVDCLREDCGLERLPETARQPVWTEFFE